MRTRAAVLRGEGQDWDVVELALEGPRAGEVTIRVEHAGLCHSDEHLRHGSAGRFPIVGGHEAAGVVELVGDGVTSVAVGDHVVTSFIPVCGTCRWCRSGRSYLCDMGAAITSGELPDGTYRFTDDSGPEPVGIGGFCCLGTFARRTTVFAGSVVKVDPSLPLDVACLLACGVPTGWGSAVRVAKVEPGETVVVYGVGGVGANALQGARMAGAATVVAVDPAGNKEIDALALGATHFFTDHGAAFGFVHDHTGGVLAERAIVATGNVDSTVVEQAFAILAKDGTLCLTGMSDGIFDLSVQLPGTLLSAYGKRVVGTLFGSCNPHVDIPLLGRMYQAGQLQLDRLVTARYTLDQVNEGYADMLAGKNLRGVLDLTSEA